MAVIGSLQEQHGELRRLAQGIRDLFDGDRLARSGTAVRLSLSAFARKLRVHLALEERFVCERLLRHSDRAIVGLAMQHRHDIRSLDDRIATHARRWISEAEIQKAPRQFIEETTSILELASKRFELEDQDLYPLVEQIISPSGTWPVDLMDTRRIRDAG